MTPITELPPAPVGGKVPVSTLPAPKGSRVPATPIGASPPSSQSMSGADGNSWTGWEAAVLQAAGLPVTQNNITFLTNWHTYELSSARFNPLNVTGYAPVPATVGIGTFNSTGVQDYATPAAGAAATAAFLKMSNYGSLFAALKSGDPYNYITSSSAQLRSVTGEIAKWGTPSYAALLIYEGGSAGPGSGPPAPDTSVTQVHVNPTTGKTSTSTTTGPQDPLISGIESWVTTESKLALAYLVLVATAGALVVTGLKGLGAPIPSVRQVAEKAAAA